MTTVLDVIRRASSDAEFAKRFAKHAVGAARAIGLQLDDRDDAEYIEARLHALARALDRKTRRLLAETAAEMVVDLGLAPEAATVEAARAAFFVRDFRFHRRLLNRGVPYELQRLIERFRCHGSPAQDNRGTLMLTPRYGPFPLLWLKHAQARGALRAFSLFYDTRFYTPDVPSAQYERLAIAGTVPRERRDIDVGAIGVPAALREAVARLRSGGNMLMLPDAFAVPVSERTLLCRVGLLEVGYPRGPVWLAETARCAVQGAVIRPRPTVTTSSGAPLDPDRSTIQRSAKLCRNSSTHPSRAILPLGSRGSRTRDVDAFALGGSGLEPAADAAAPRMGDGT